MTTKHDILEHARFLTELSVIDYFFVPKRAASIALAALLNAMDSSRSFPFAARFEFLAQLNKLEDFDPNHQEVEECRERLQDLYVQGGYASASVTSPDTPNPVPQEQQDMEMEQRIEAVSPVSVVAFGDQGQVQASKSVRNVPDNSFGYYSGASTSMAY